MQYTFSMIIRGRYYTFQRIANRFVLPHPLKNSNDCNLSFSGLKTAVRKIIESYDESGNIEHVILSKKVDTEKKF